MALDHKTLFELGIVMAALAERMADGQVAQAPESKNDRTDREGLHLIFNHCAKDIAARHDADDADIRMLTDFGLDRFFNRLKELGAGGSASDLH